MNHLIQNKSILFSLIAALGLSACQNERQSHTSEASSTHTREILLVKSQNEWNTRSIAARVASENQNQITSRMTGFITEMRVQEGQKVSAGQVLFRIDPLDVDGQISQANASENMNLAQLKDAQADFERYDRLYQDSAIPKAQWEKMKLNYEVAIEKVKSSKANSHQAFSQKRYTEITAPMSGVITAKMSSVGDLALPGKPVLTLENAGKLEIQAQIPEELYPSLKSQAQFCVNFTQMNQPLCDLKIKSVVPVSDPVSHTHFTTFALSPKQVAEAALRSGLLGEISIPSTQNEKIVIPQRALIKRSGITGVFVLDTQNKIHFNMVRAVSAPNSSKTHTSEDMALVVSGLRVNDRVVLNQLDSLKSGDIITPILKGAHP